MNYNNILGRDSISQTVKSFLNNFENNKQDLSIKRGLYIYGAPGSGKTEFITRILKELNYDIIKYDAGDIRNKNIIENITKNNMAEKSVLSLFHKKTKQIAIIMDEIDGMNNGDKGGLNSLIRIIRPKKTKKQKLEELSYNPIICISSYHVDKKIKELMKVCSVIELETPKPEQLQKIIKLNMPTIDDIIVKNIVTYLKGDLRKLASMHNIYDNNHIILKNEIIQDILKPKSYNEDTKEITHKLLNNNYKLTEHINIMNDTDRTIVGLLWHENIIDMLSKKSNNFSMPLYHKILDEICFSDYIDRITFQKQIWQFNEMSSLIKTFYTNKIYHDTMNKYKENKVEIKPESIRFTKVLTKYSTEYNNSLFIQNLCQQLSMDKKDTLSFFLNLRNNYVEEEIYNMFELYDINKLDINRIYRYIDKYTNKNFKSDKNDLKCIEDIDDIGNDVIVEDY